MIIVMKIINLSEVLNESEDTNTRKFIRTTICTIMYGAQFREFIYRRRSKLDFQTFVSGKVH
jgi:hypothetical protein